MLQRFYTGTRAEVSVCVWWLAYSPQGDELSLARGSHCQCPGQNPTGIHVGSQSCSSGHKRDPTSTGTPCLACLRHAAV